MIKEEVKMDNIGRIIIPKYIRKKYGIQKNSLLSLKLTKNGIEIKKDDIHDKYKSILKKIKQIEKTNIFEILLIKESKIIYTSNKYKNLLNKLITDKIKSDIARENEIKKIKITLNDFEEGCLVLIYNKTYEEEADIISELVML